MQLRFIYHGRQFFFLTLCVKGRRPLLSRIIDEKSRPALTPVGECVRHPVLDASRRWDAIGNLTLLASPFFFPVRLTLKKTVAEHQAAIDTILTDARYGMIPVSGFLSPGEKEVLCRLKAEPHVRFIKTLPYALPPRYDPSAEDSRELAANRLLILSGFPQSAPSGGFRANCLLMNDLITDLCSLAQTLTPA
ncbi:MAG: hypothetical protein J6336_01020 [Kiritimatiellae bacterium]|nr:hypothetical protein [Kiritimatiellia bacterium]